MSNEDKVKSWYQQYLGRDPSSEWLGKQVKALEDGHDVESDIRNSDEARRYFTNKISDAYRNVLGRGVDQGGLEEKIASLQAGEFNVNDLEHILRESPEGQELQQQQEQQQQQQQQEQQQQQTTIELPTVDNPHWSQQIRDAFQELLNRQPNPEGYDHYLNQMRSGWTVEQVRADIENSHEYQNLHQPPDPDPWDTPQIKDAVKELFNKYLYREPTEDDYKHYGPLYSEKGYDGVRADLKGSPEGQRKEFIVAQYIEHLQREPSWEVIDQASQHLEVSGWIGTVDNPDNNEIKHTFNQGIIQSEEWQNLNRVDLPEGKFGAKQYYQMLKLHKDDPLKLQEIRVNVLHNIGQMTDDQKKNYLEDGKLAGEGGLYDWIQKSGEPGHIGSEFGSPDEIGETSSGELRFSEADYLAAIAGGQEQYRIYNWMKDNKNQWDIEGTEGNPGREIYNNVRGGLIQKADQAGNLYDKDVYDDEGNLTYSWRNNLQNPLWQEYGEAMVRDGIAERKDPEWWRTNKDAYKLIRNHLDERSEHFDWMGDRGEGFKTDAQLQELIRGWGAEKTFRPGRGAEWTEEGTYWEQWGSEGPKDGLTDVQLTAAIDAVDDEAKLNALEVRWHKELYEGGIYDTGRNNKHGDVYDQKDPIWESAKDEWGLDIRRVDANGDPIEWSDKMFKVQGKNNRTDEMIDSWYETLTKGDIDWAFYQDDRTYNLARESLGMDDRIDTVQEIRQANIWVHGHRTVDLDDKPDWIKYQPQFDPSTAQPYVPKELTVTGYKPETLDPVDTAPEGPKNLKINVSPVDIEVPDTIPSAWTVHES